MNFTASRSFDKEEKYIFNLMENICIHLSILHLRLHETQKFQVRLHVLNSDPGARFISEKYKKCISARVV